MNLSDPALDPMLDPMLNPAFVWPAPAKLNLFLHITGRREDDYHLLQTVFQFVDSGDSLTFVTSGAIPVTLPVGHK